MSILSFLKSLLDIFKKNFPDFVAKIAKKIPDALKAQLVLVIISVENIKKFVDSPSADFMTAVIPGTADDEFKAWLRKALPVVLESLRLTQDGLSFSPDKDTKSAELHSIAALLTKSLTGTDFGQASITTEAVYQEYKSNGIK